MPTENAIMNSCLTSDIPAPITLNSPRVRFNWGFHDATFDREIGKQDRRDIPAGQIFCLPQGSGALPKAYRDGYEFGMTCDMSQGRPESSEAAWQAHVAKRAS